jgi:arabinan endo-1,5-alpha-L-arabinosidase
MQDEQRPMSFEIEGDIRQIHDPVTIAANDRYYLFATGTGITMRHSEDLIHWDYKPPTRALRASPRWTREAVPGSGDFWAPDIAYFNDRYHLYYSVSTFGSNISAIGLATNVTLDFDDDAYGWLDAGPVVQSSRSDNFNAIDPNLTFDKEGAPWLAFGSHWGGIKMIRLDYDTGLPSEAATTLYSLAQRRIHPRAVEGPYIIYQGDYYYLFVSFDQCCQGVNSTYNVRVGRSAAITGPYLDRDSRPMMEDGGTQITFPTDRWRGPGHNSILRENGIDYMVYHAYDAENNGIFTLRIDPITWDAEGWPTLSANL